MMIDGSILSEANSQPDSWAYWCICKSSSVTRLSLSLLQGEVSTNKQKRECKNRKTVINGVLTRRRVMVVMAGHATHIHIQAHKRAEPILDTAVCKVTAVQKKHSEKEKMRVGWWWSRRICFMGGSLRKKEKEKSNTKVAAGLQSFFLSTYRKSAVQFSMIGDLNFLVIGMIRDFVLMWMSGVSVDHLPIRGRILSVGDRWWQWWRRGFGVLVYGVNNAGVEVKGYLKV